VSPLQHLDALDDALAARGFPRTSSWWRAVLDRFFASTAKQLVLRVGRRGGKSSVLCRVAALLALFGEWTVTPGDVGIIGFVSVNRDESAQRIRMIKAILDAIGVAWKPIENGIELEGKPIAFKTFTASVSGVVGGTWIALIGDELARWRDVDSGANPAREVLASARPTLAGMAGARIFLSSSPLGSTDHHATLVDAGETSFQQVAIAATWIARPELTEAECHELEPDPDVFGREYGAIPHDGSATSLVSETQLLAVTRRSDLVLPRDRAGTYVAAIDPATRSNGWTLAIGRVLTADDVASVQIVCCREWRAAKGVALDSDETLREVAGILHGFDLEACWTDQWSYDSLRSIASRHNVDLRLEASSATSKVQAFDNLRRLVVDRRIELPDIPQLRADLLGVRKLVGRSGAMTVDLEKSGGRHCDFASALALCASKASESVPLGWFAARARAGLRAYVTGGTVPQGGNIRTFDHRGPVDTGYLADTDPQIHPERHVIACDDPPAGALGVRAIARYAGEYEGMFATWRRGAPESLQYSANSSPAWRAAVESFRAKYPQ
jgi:hypothetical protein